MHSTPYLFAFALIASLGCAPSSDAPTAPAGPTGGTGGTTETTPTATGPDIQAPSVLATTPVDGAIGQWADLVVEIAFDEPMDPASVEAAVDTVELGEVEFSWNVEGDVLSILPIRPLQYARGPGDAPLTARDYALTVGTTATDLAGNRLAEPVAIHFSTLRELWLVMGPDDALTRTVTPSDFVYDPSDPLVMGDTVANDGMRTAVTFDLSWIPTETVAVSEAILTTQQTPGDNTGAPFDALGDLVLDHVIYPDWDQPNAINAAFNSDQASLDTHLAICVEDQILVEVDVTADVDEDIAERITRLDRAQFLIRFEGFTDLDGAMDRAVLSRDDLGLELTYLVP